MLKDIKRAAYDFAALNPFRIYIVYLLSFKLFNLWHKPKEFMYKLLSYYMRKINPVTAANGF